MGFIVTDLPDDLLFIVCEKLDWFGQDCMLLTSKTTRAAVLPIVRAKARTDALLNGCMHMLARLVSENVAGAGPVAKYRSDTFNASYLCVTQRAVAEFYSAILEANRMAGSVTADLLEHKLVVCVWITDLPATGHTYMNKRTPCVRSFTSLSEAMEHILDGWRQVGCLALV